MVVITDVCLCQYTTHGHCGVLPRRRGRQRSLARAAGRDRVVTCCRGGRHRRAFGHDGRPRRRHPRGARRRRSQPASRSWPTRPSTPPPSTGRSVTPRAPRPPTATGAATRWIPPTVVRRFARCCSTSRRAPTWSWSKPAMPYLDVIAEVRRATRAPIAAYQVSGEYAMIKAAAAAGLLDERAAALESLIAIKRAGADMVITYWAGGRGASGNGRPGDDDASRRACTPRPSGSSPAASRARCARCARSAATTRCSSTAARAAGCTTSTATATWTGCSRGAR